jgi:hypothetical protein
MQNTKEFLEALQAEADRLEAEASKHLDATYDQDRYPMPQDGKDWRHYYNGQCNAYMVMSTKIGLLLHKLT